MKPEIIKKIAVKKNGVLFSKSRILDGQRFETAGGLEAHEGLQQFGFRSLTPLVDRYSPLAYSIGDYIHRVVANLGGYKICYRESLNYVFIFQGTGLFRELGADCVICQKLRGKYIEASMAPLSDHQLTIAPAFWITMADIMGPVFIYVPGHAMKTRNKQD